MSPAHPLLIGFGRALLALRQERGLTQEALARQAGVHRNYASSAERGQRNVALINIERFALALGVTPGELLDLAGQLAPKTQHPARRGSSEGAPTRRSG
jgi:transcriptional regulator with XRE-family HTH domain